MTGSNLSIAIIVEITRTKTQHNDLNFNTIEVLSHVAIKNREHRDRINLNLVQKCNPDLFMTEKNACAIMLVRGNLPRKLS